MKYEEKYNIFADTGTDIRIYKHTQKQVKQGGIN